MERRSFLKLLFGAVAAIATGVKAEETPPKPIFTHGSITKNKGDTVVLRRVVFDDTSPSGIGFEDVTVNNESYAKMMGERMASTRKMIFRDVLKGKI